MMNSELYNLAHPSLLGLITAILWTPDYHTLSLSMPKKNIWKIKNDFYTLVLISGQLLQNINK